MPSDEENESVGPKVGIKLSLDEANLVLQRHLKLCAISFSLINTGYNNRVYIVTASDSQEYVIRLSGRCWTRRKTENEVAALVYIAKMYPDLPVPKIFGYCTDKSLSGVNAEYILMERIKGEPLENYWKQMSLLDKKNVMDQVVQIFASFRKIQFSKIGSFQLEAELFGNSFGIGIHPMKDISPEHVEISKGVEFDGGPFDSYLDYIRSSCETEIGCLKTIPFMQDSKGYEKRLRRVETFVSAFEKMESVPDAIQGALLNVPFVFTHGDFEPRNVMYDKDSRKITGVLDFEFGGSYPIDEDWFTSFSFANAATSDSRVFNDGPVDNDSDEDNCSKQEVREYFLKQMEKNGVATPDKIPGHMIRAELYYFKGFICPWWLKEKRDPIPETHFTERENASNKVDYILDKYGF